MKPITVIIDEKNITLETEEDVVNMMTNMEKHIIKSNTTTRNTVALSILNGMLARGVKHYDHHTGKKYSKALMEDVYRLADEFIVEGNK